MTNKNETQRTERERLETMFQKKLPRDAALLYKGVYPQEDLEYAKTRTKKNTPYYGSSQGMLGRWAINLLNKARDENARLKEIKEFRDEMQKPEYRAELEKYESLGTYAQKAIIKFNETSEKDDQITFHAIPSFFRENGGFGYSNCGMERLLEERIALGELGIVKPFKEEELGELADGAKTYAKTILSRGINTILRRCKFPETKDAKTMFQDRFISQPIGICYSAMFCLARFELSPKDLEADIGAFRKIIADLASYIAKRESLASANALIGKFEEILKQ